jgi:hypothetical protein
MVKNYTKSKTVQFTYGMYVFAQILNKTQGYSSSSDNKEVLDGTVASLGFKIMGMIEASRSTIVMISANGNLD